MTSRWCPETRLNGFVRRLWGGLPSFSSAAIFAHSNGRQPEPEEPTPMRSESGIRRPSAMTRRLLASLRA